MQQESIANLAKAVEFYETDESDVDELLDPHGKSLIQEDLRAESGKINTIKINKNDDDISASKGNNLVSKNEDRALGKLDKPSNTFANMTLLQKNQMQ